MTNMDTKQNAKKLTKYFRKKGFLAKQVKVETGYAPNGQPIKDNVSVVSFAEENGDRYDIRFGYLVNKEVAIPYMWNFDTYNNKHIDIRPLPNGTGVYKDMAYVDVDTIDDPFALFAATYSGKNLNVCTFLPSGRIVWLSNESAEQLGLYTAVNS